VHAVTFRITMINKNRNTSIRHNSVLCEYEKSALQGRRGERVKVSRRVEEAHHRRGVARSSRVAQQATDGRPRGAVKQ